MYSIVERNLKSFNADTQAMTFYGAILSPAGLVQGSAILTLTNAQLLALPTTPIAEIPAPGVGKAISIVRATGSLDATAGAYTNVDATAGIFFGYGGSAVKASNSASCIGTFDTAQKSLFLWNGGLISTANQTTPGALAGLQSHYENVAVDIAVLNAAAGVFTGGNAANTMRLTIDYLIISL